MDYEKKYRDLVEAVKELQEANPSDDGIQKWVKDNVPELMESEDEKIRKWLIAQLKIKSGDNDIVLENRIAEAIAWLEKQGDKDKLIKELGEYKVKYTQEVLEKQLNSMSNKDDERLRKTAIDFLKDFAEQGYENAVECIDWLKKQGEQNKWKPSKEEMDALYGLAYITNKIDDKKDEALTRLYQDLKREFFNGVSCENMFPSSHVTNIDGKNQGEQNTKYKQFICKKDWHGIGDYCCGKTYNGYPCEKEQEGYTIYDDNYLPTICDEDFINEYFNIITEEKQSEQKPTDNAAPKFHEGEWIACAELNAARIISIVDDFRYEVEFIDGRTFYPYIDYIDKDFHRWTIKDAKDGDVLKEDSCTFIIERMKSAGAAIVHCCLFDDGDFDLVGSTLGFDIDSTYPATKEQRDTLEKAITNAGYRWDAEKRELKKVEQKNTWKPTVKQMNALDSTLQYKQVSSNCYEHLNSLFNDLKKLKEE